MLNRLLRPRSPIVYYGVLVILLLVLFALGTQAGSVRFLFISVDAQRDSPEVMADYLGNFG